MMDQSLHSISTVFNDIVQLIVNLHLVCLFIINVTKSPRRALQSTESYTYLKRLYRIIELLAGLITPLAKR